MTARPGVEPPTLASVELRPYQLSQQGPSGWAGINCPIPLRLRDMQGPSEYLEDVLYVIREA